MTNYRGRKRIAGQRRTSDGYHTFNELYDHRAKLFSVIVAAFPEKSWKSKRHSDGTMYEGMFIVGIETPDGQATYHYDIDPYWNIFNCKELESAPEWDGHTPSQAIDRIASLAELIDPKAERTCSLKFNGATGYVCTCCGVSLASKYFTDSNNELWRIKKCPNCGAKVMD